MSNPIYLILFLIDFPDPKSDAPALKLANEPPTIRRRRRNKLPEAASPPPAAAQPTNIPSCPSLPPFAPVLAENSEASSSQKKRIASGTVDQRPIKKGSAGGSKLHSPFIPSLFIKWIYFFAYIDSKPSISANKRKVVRQKKYLIFNTLDTQYANDVLP